MAQKDSIESIKWYNEIKEQMTKYAKEMFSRQDFNRLNDFANLRHFDIELVKSKGIFYVESPLELMLPEYMDRLEDFGLISNTNNRPIYHKRWVIPIRDTDGKVVNFVGYSPDANERYVYGTSAIYLRRDTLYGLENLDLAYKLGYGILCEGITDAIALHNIGYNIAFGNCGTFRSGIGMSQLSRLKYGVIKIPDRDSAGRKADKEWQFNRSVKINVPVNFKDIDEVLKKEELRETVKEHIEAVIQYIKNTPSNFRDEVTITY